MRAIILENGQYSTQQCADPALPDNHVLIQVEYAGVNRADLFQKQGKYPLPTHAIPGMEVSGTIKTCSKSVTHLKPGDKVGALMAEGGYAQYASVPASLVLPIPEAISME